jgi:Tol biopolymer transport system component
VYLGNGDPLQMVWFDRKGTATDSGWAKQMYGGPRFSPDGQQVAVDITDPRSGTADIWIYDLARNVGSRFTADLVTETTAVWSPDGRRILFRTERGGAPNLFTKAFEGAGEVEPMVIHPGPLICDDWSSDGRMIAYTMNSQQTNTDIWMKPLVGDRKPRAFLATRFEESGPRFSPDSSSVAFVSNETGATPEVYVAPVEQPAQRRQVSVGGGTGPRWRRDGKELFYISADNRTIMSVPIESIAPFKAGLPSRLFTIGTEPASRDRGRNPVYDVMPDGQRFLVSVGAGEPESSRMTVVLNWTAAIK